MGYYKDDDDEIDEEQFAELDAFLAYVKELSEGKEKISIINPERLKEFQDACETLSLIIKEENPEGKISYHIDAEAGSGDITIEAITIDVGNVKGFIKGIEKANNFDIIPLTNGTVRMGVVFYGVLQTVGYRDT